MYVLSTVIRWENVGQRAAWPAGWLANGLPIRTERFMDALRIVDAVDVDGKERNEKERKSTQDDDVKHVPFYPCFDSTGSFLVTVSIRDFLIFLETKDR
jgi:hypothetical protein